MCVSFGLLVGFLSLCSRLDLSKIHTIHMYNHLLHLHHIFFNVYISL